MFAALFVVAPGAQARTADNPAINVQFSTSGQIAVSLVDGTPLGTSSGAPTHDPGRVLHPANDRPRRLREHAVLRPEGPGHEHRRQHGRGRARLLELQHPPRCRTRPTPGATTMSFLRSSTRSRRRARPWRASGNASASRGFRPRITARRSRSTRSGRATPVRGKLMARRQRLWQALDRLQGQERLDAQVRDLHDRRHRQELDEGLHALTEVEVGERHRRLIRRDEEPPGHLDGREVGLRAGSRRQADLLCRRHR